MDITSLLIILILAGASGLIISRPFYSPRDKEFLAKKNADRDLTVVLTGQKEKNLKLIRDLETDRLLGKISPLDFESIREQLFLDTAIIQENLEEISRKSIQTRADEKSGPSPEKRDQPVLYCASCGKQARPKDVFCSRCGKKIHAD